MHQTRHALISLLSDGHFHSGEVLGAALGISRGAVWKQIAALNELGLDVYRVPGRGYRFAKPLELLSAELIRDALPEHARRRLSELTVLDSVDSTNAWLQKQHGDGVMVCLAEQQTAGRGRRGRGWTSPYGANLYFSLSWPFASLPPDFGAMSLAVGIAVRRALQEMNIPDVQLKWPNDLYARGAKLGGILLEMRGEPPGACRVVAGIGVNVAMPEKAAAEIDQAWVDLASLAGVAVSRNVLAARLIEQLFEVLETFSREGFRPFLAEWRQADCLMGHEVVVSDANQRWQGMAAGIAADGALEVNIQGETRRFLVGDVSLRGAA